MTASARRRIRIASTRASDRTVQLSNPRVIDPEREKKGKKKKKKEKKEIKEKKTSNLTEKESLNAKRKQETGTSLPALGALSRLQFFSRFFSSLFFFLSSSGRRLLPQGNWRRPSKFPCYFSYPKRKEQTYTAPDDQKTTSHFFPHSYSPTINEFAAHLPPLHSATAT